MLALFVKCVYSFYRLLVFRVCPSPPTQVDRLFWLSRNSEEYEFGKTRLVGFIIVNLAAWGIVGVTTAMFSWIFGLGVCIVYLGNKNPLQMSAVRKRSDRNIWWWMLGYQTWTWLKWKISPLQCTQVHCGSDWFSFLAGKAGTDWVLSWLFSSKFLAVSTFWSFRDDFGDPSNEPFGNLLTQTVRKKYMFILKHLPPGSLT